MQLDRNVEQVYVFLIGKIRRIEGSIRVVKDQESSIIRNRDAMYTRFGNSISNLLSISDRLCTE